MNIQILYYVYKGKMATPIKPTSQPFSSSSHSGNWFMISTVSDKNEAHLLVYQMKLSDYHEYIASLSKTLKKFTSKPIKQVGGCYYLLSCRVLSVCVGGGGGGGGSRVCSSPPLLPNEDICPHVLSRPLLFLLLIYCYELFGCGLI